jgi:serine/threonine-protein kinase
MSAMTALATALTERYRIERELGAGGMATVYLAEDIKHQRKVALKVFRPELAAVLGAERFLKEIQVTAKLQHPHILSLFDSGAADGFLYYVMPYVEGESLRQRLDREKMFSLQDAVQIATQVASALEYAHRHGVVHRDIKPENILLHEGEAMLADFGIALAVQEAGGDRITQTGLSLGTPQYMSPEQATGERDIDARSDIYSLGAVTYEMLAGAPPLAGPSARAIIAKLLTEKPASLRVFRDSVSTGLDSAVLRALAKTSADRFANVKEFSAALKASASSISAPAPTPVRQTTKVRRRRIVAIATMLTAVVTVVVTRPRWNARDASHQPTAPGVQSVAVLPFAVRNSEGDEFLGDGIAETLIYALGKVPGMKVAAQTSSFTFKGKNVDLKTIGDQLGVASVLTGSLQRAAGRLRITVRLENVADHRELWTERFDSDLKDVFALQDSIGRAVVNRLQANRQIGSATVVDVGTRNVEAYQDYLQGRALWGQRGEGVRRGLAFFERAVTRDSNYALAWTGVADTYALLNVYGEMAADRAVPNAKRAVERALALDSTLAAAHATRGLLFQTYDYDWNKAERELRRSVELDPNYVIGHYWYGNLLASALNRVSDGIVQTRQATALDPLSPHAANLLAETLARFGGEDAVIEAHRAVSLAPTWTNYRILGWAFRKSGHLREAIAGYDSALALSPGNPWLLYPRGALLSEAGDTTAAERAYRDVLAAAEAGRAQTLMVALAAAWAGRDDEALRLLEKARATHDALVGYPQGNWWPTRLTADSRFVAFWTRLGVSPPLPFPPINRQR